MIGKCLPGFAGVCKLCLQKRQSLVNQYGDYLRAIKPDPKYTCRATDHYRMLTNTVHMFLPDPTLWTMSVKRESKSIKG